MVAERRLAGRVPKMFSPKAARTWKTKGDRLLCTVCHIWNVLVGKTRCPELTYVVLEALFYQSQASRYEVPTVRGRVNGKRWETLSRIAKEVGERYMVDMKYFVNSYSLARTTLVCLLRMCSSTSVVETNSAIGRSSAEKEGGAEVNKAL